MTRWSLLLTAVCVAVFGACATSPSAGDTVAAADALEVAEPGDAEVDAGPDGGAVDALDAADDGAGGAADDGGADACPDGGWPRRVLLIGNSYTSVNDLAGTLTAALDGHPCARGAHAFADAYAPGGYRLPQHLADANDPQSPLYAKLRDPAGWDAVVVQDQSQIPGFDRDEEITRRSREALPGLVTLAHDAGADVYLMMTWGRRDGDATNAAIFGDYAAMQARLAAGYADYAAYAIAETGITVTVSPVGLAWQAVRDGAGGVASDVAAAHFGGLYASDGSHPSPRGTYLAAATLLATVTGASPAVGAATPGGDAGDKPWLDAAADAVTAP
jgi:hypothetical protein